MNVGWGEARRTPNMGPASLRDVGVRVPLTPAYIFIPAYVALLKHK